MFATISAKGVLRIEPETPIESYALDKWIRENSDVVLPENLIIHIQQVLKEEDD